MKIALTLPLNVTETKICETTAICLIKISANTAVLFLKLNKYARCAWFSYVFDEYDIEV